MPLKGRGGSSPLQRTPPRRLDGPLGRRRSPHRRREGAASSSRLDAVRRSLYLGGEHTFVNSRPWRREMLTARQQEIWDFLVEYVDDHGYPPTVREIGEARRAGLAVDRPRPPREPRARGAAQARPDEAARARAHRPRARAQAPARGERRARAAARRRDRRRRAAARRAEHRGLPRGARAARAAATSSSCASRATR